MPELSIHAAHAALILADNALANLERDQPLSFERQRDVRSGELSALIGLVRQIGAACTALALPHAADASPLPDWRVAKIEPGKEWSCTSPARMTALETLAAGVAGMIERNELTQRDGNHDGLAWLAIAVAETEA